MVCKEYHSLMNRLDEHILVHIVKCIVMEIYLCIYIEFDDYIYLYYFIVLCNLHEIFCHHISCMYLDNGVYIQVEQGIVYCNHFFQNIFQLNNHNLSLMNVRILIFWKLILNMVSYIHFIILLKK